MRRREHEDRRPAMGAKRALKPVDGPPVDSHHEMVTRSRPEEQAVSPLAGSYDHPGDRSRVVRIGAPVGHALHPRRGTGSVSSLPRTRPEPLGGVGRVDPPFGA